MFAADKISTPIPFNADVSDDVALAEGDEAADRVLSRADLIDHLKVGRALMVGSRIAAKEAGCNRGKPYNIAFNKWLQQHPKLAAVNEHNRAAALWCLDEANWPRVEKYLAKLDIDERQTISLRTVRRRLDVPPPALAPKPADATAAPKAATQADAVRSGPAIKDKPPVQPDDGDQVWLVNGVADYRKPSRAYGELMAHYDGLHEAYEKLRTDSFKAVDEIVKEYDGLVKDYDELAASNAKDTADYNKLLNDCDGLRDSVTESGLDVVVKKGRFALAIHDLDKAHAWFKAADAAFKEAWFQRAVVAFNEETNAPVETAGET